MVARRAIQLESLKKKKKKIEYNGILKKIILALATYLSYFSVKKPFVVS